MQIDVIRGETREAGGRKANNRLRKSGLVPAIVYGHGQPPQTLALSEHELMLALQTKTHVIKVALGGTQEAYLLKEVQYDHLQIRPVHVDLMRVDVTETVRVSVPVELKGEAIGTKEGGVVVPVITDIEVECSVLQIPESLRLVITDLNIGDALHVRDLTLPPGVKVLHEPDELIVTVKTKRGTETAEEGEAPAEGGSEPEVIGRGKPQDEESGE